MSLPLSADEFAALMAPLGPWPATRRVAVAVSGGADSVCLAALLAAWGKPFGLIVDHGLRRESAAEARLTCERLAAFGVPAQVIELAGLRPGPGVPERARAARHAALRDAAINAGCVDLLLAHHRRDQVETVLMRRDAGSGPAGQAGMAPVVETNMVRLVRPLLAVAPGRLRATLRARGLAWVEDPTNQNTAYTRARVRSGLADADGDGPGIAAVAAEARAAALQRGEDDRAAAASLATLADIHPEGFAILRPGKVPPLALANLVRAIAGAAYLPPREAVARLAADPRPAVLHGVQFLSAGRLGPGLLVVREASAMAPPVAAAPGGVWDGRFGLGAGTNWPAGALFGAVGDAAARLRRTTSLPAAVLRTLPGIWQHGVLVSVPHIGYPAPSAGLSLAVCACPGNPVAGAPFSPAG